MRGKRTRPLRWQRLAMASLACHRILEPRDLIDHNSGKNMEPPGRFELPAC
ncbi:MAG: hypothetical protein QW520_02320 [Methanomassiliicoccales archaeon]